MAHVDGPPGASEGSVVWVSGAGGPALPAGRVCLVVYSRQAVCDCLVNCGADWCTGEVRELATSIPEPAPWYSQVEPKQRPIGYGTMQLAGDRVWGPPPDWMAALHLLRQAYSLGCRVLDTAWYYGPYVTHQLIAEALAPYPDDLLIVSKLGNSRRADRSWVPALAAADLRQACELDLRLLGLEALPLVLLRWHPDWGGEEKFQEALNAVLDLQSAGKVCQIGLSNVSSREVKIALSMTPIGAVSNAFSIFSRREPEVVDLCTSLGIMFLPYYPLLGGDVARRTVLQRLARELRLTAAQVALAWLRARSPVVVPIPGTRRPRHLAENVDAQRVSLPRDVLSRLDGLDRQLRG